MSRIFISYARDTITAAQAIARDLEFLDHRVWFDQELAGGQDWWDTILGELRQADVVLAMVSPSSLESVPCRLELEYAQRLLRHVVPVRVSTSVDPALLPGYLAQLQLVDRVQDDKPAVLRLLRALQRLPAPRPLPSPLPAPPKAPVSPLASLRDEIDSATDLTRMQQWDLTGRLKSAMADPKQVELARQLARRLLQREDLLAVVATELRATLQAEPAASPPAPAPAPRVASPAGPPRAPAARAPASKFADHAPGPGSTLTASAASTLGSRPDWERQARAELRAGNKILAIKIVREGTGLALKEAKDLVDSW